jgi:hypothetical protein
VIKTPNLLINNRGAKHKIDTWEEEEASEKQLLKRLMISQ